MSVLLSHWFCYFFLAKASTFVCSTGSSNVNCFDGLTVFFLDKNLIILSPAFSPTCSPVFVAAVVIAFVAAVLQLF